MVVQDNTRTIQRHTLKNKRIEQFHSHTRIKEYLGYTRPHDDRPTKAYKRRFATTYSVTRDDPASYVTR